jgi:hypothetical protein
MSARPSSRTSQDTIHGGEISPNVSAFRDRRYSEASNVLPIDIGHSERSSSGSSNSSARSHGSPTAYAPILNAAGLPTPPGSSEHRHDLSYGSLVNGPSSVSYLSIADHDDPAVLSSLHHYSRDSLSPLSGGFRTFSNPQSPLISPPLRARASTSQMQVPCVCTFYDGYNGSMGLYPPGNMENQTPLYLIRVAPNCFMPTSYITTIERGGSRQLVARFE